MVTRKVIEFSQPGFQKRLCARSISAAIMMERSRHLDDTLKKGLLRLGRVEPDFFPGFVRFEKLPGVELFDAAPKLLVVVLSVRHVTPSGRNSEHVQEKVFREAGNPETLFFRRGIIANCMAREGWDGDSN